MKCIYCLTEDPARFTKREHVIPESFGTFGGDTPVLRCVCTKCNEEMGRDVDQPFARESLEGVQRYRHGILSSETRPVKRIKFTLGETEEMGEFSGALVEIDGQSGKITPPVPQAHFKRLDDGKVEVFRLDELKGLDWKAKGLSDKGIKIMGPQEEDRERLIQALASIGIPFRETSRFASPLPIDKETQTIQVHIEGTVDSLAKRGLVKILFNFVAYYLGPDEVLKPEWDKARRFVRYGENILPGRASQDPFWGHESETKRLKSRGYNIRVENGPKGVIGTLQMFNQFTYTFLLAEDHNIPEEKEVGYRFEPGEAPSVGKKFTRPQSPQDRVRKNP